LNAEQIRLEEAATKKKHWRRWGPYLSERQWGTVREDYSADGDAWEYFPFQQAHLRAYRWGEDGLLGICDNHQRVCFAVALWNGKDSILKERLFGLTNEEGVHGEDVKELYYYLDSTPTHSYLKGLYKYPQGEFPYERLKQDGGAELFELGAFDGGRYFDVEVEYAKADEEDILIRLTVTNRGADAAPLHVLPTVWFRNWWSWGPPHRPKPRMWAAAPSLVALEEPEMGALRLWADGEARLLFTENESNTEKLWNYPSGVRHYKDAFHEAVVRGNLEAANPQQTGTKACVWYSWILAAGESRSTRLRLSKDGLGAEGFEETFEKRRAESDEFYAAVQAEHLSEDGRRVQRQAFAGLLWSKQFYNYIVETWLKGDPAGPPPSRAHQEGRNRGWKHLYCDDILSMPDNWEYPWFAAWDLAFHMIPFALIDASYAKRHLNLFLREWYLHPNGQMPAYEWNLSDVNPPVHAWACWRVFQIDRKQTGKGDLRFLEAAYHKLLMNFTWWVNRKDSLGHNIFEGGFLGLDNIGVFDRSQPLPTGGVLEQSDATSWMAMYSLNMLRIALELAQEDRAYEEIASKFFEHFLYIASAMNRMGGNGLWDDEDGFFYDRISFDGQHSTPLRVRSLVGLIPLFAVETFDQEIVQPLKGFRRRAQWFIDHRTDLCSNLSIIKAEDGVQRGMLSLVSLERLKRVLRVMLMETEFLSPYGIRSMSRYHLRAPYILEYDGTQHRVDYEPGESSSRLFGGNSNWRGPVWFPVNYLLIESLQQFHHFYGDSLRVEFPTGSGQTMNLGEVAAELSRRLSRLFLRGEDGRRPCFGNSELLQKDPQFRDHLLFHEYFHGDDGTGLGANHQTGWTALLAKMLQQSGE
jgi:hypothetical protein